VARPEAASTQSRGRSHSPAATSRPKLGKRRISASLPPSKAPRTQPDDTAPSARTRAAKSHAPRGRRGKRSTLARYAFSLHPDDAHDEEDEQSEEEQPDEGEDGVKKSGTLSFDAVPEPLRTGYFKHFIPSILAVLVGHENMWYLNGEDGEFSLLELAQIFLFAVYPDSYTVLDRRSLFYKRVE
jgi:hypothetical protein